MSGHSKWSTIKHKKAAQDAKRGAMFTKVIKELTVAARMGGGDVDMNPRLRTAVLKAKAVNMPQDTMQRAIMKGTGELPGVNYEEITYEGYGPGGVAMIVTVLTDNRNRTVAGIRKIFSKSGGNLGESGCVAWMFQKKGLIVVDKEKVDEDELHHRARSWRRGCPAGRCDVRSHHLGWRTSSPLGRALPPRASSPPAPKSASSHRPRYGWRAAQARQLLKLMDELEEHDDVQNVYANFDIPDEVMAEV